MVQYKVFEQEEDWKAFRAQYFTSSEITRLLTEPTAAAKNKGEVLSAGAKTYVMERVAGILAPVEPSYYNSAMEHGNVTEPQAVIAFADSIGMSINDPDFIYTSVGGYVFFYDDDYDIGGTPDAIVKSRDLSAEMKCPKSATHVRYLTYRTQEDVKKNLPEYYGQMQQNMYLTKTSTCIFQSYDDRLYDPKLHVHQVVIEKDDEYLEKLFIKAAHGKKMKMDLLKQLTGA